MKHLSLLLCVTLFAVAAPAPSARADVSVPVDFFYDALSPYGDWVYTDNYGYIWQPAAAQQPDWAPYSDGSWAYTDAGWTWISNEDHGWATYHYGRWVRMYDRWFWVPGNEWAPAWVSWRQSDDYLGWAPLPPEANWSNDVGFNWWTDSYYDIGPSYYNFVPLGSFATQASLLPFIMDRRQNYGYMDRSRNITNISYRPNVFNHIFAGGPDPDRIDRFGNGNNRVRRLSLHRDDDNFRRDWLDNRGERPRGFGSLSRIDRDRLIVAAPSIRRDNAPGLPPKVRERFDRPEIDRGWRGIGDAGAAERLRNRQREDLVKAKNDRMPEKRHDFITSKAPPPAVGRNLRPEERRDLTQRPDPRRVDEEVRKATPSGTPGSPPRVANDPRAPGADRRPGMPDRDGTPGRDGPPGRDGTPGRNTADRDGPVGRNPTDRDGNPGRDGSPGRDGTPGRNTADRDGPPGRGPNARPGASDSTPGARPLPGEMGKGGRPGEGLRPVPNGVVPNEGGDRRRGGVPSNPEQPPTRVVPNVTPPGMPQQDRPNSRPNDRPSIPPSGDRGSRPPEGRRPDATPNLPRTPAIPMPEPRNEPRSRPSPMPTPEAPRARPAPMPQPSSPPQVRPSPTPQQRPERPQPQARPTPPPSQPRGPSPQGGRPSGGPPQGGGGREDRGPGGPGKKDR